MQRELSQFSHTRDLPASQMKRSIYLFKRDLKAKVEPDGSSSWVHSATARKLLFGREADEMFKIQSGVKIAVKPQDMLVRSTPGSVTHTARGQERIQATQSFRLLAGACAGSYRSVSLTNRGEAVAKVRILTLHDPTSLNYRRERDPPGEIGVNAFNRNDHVVMDDVGDTTGVRVVGFEPRPSVIFMTRDRSRAAELLSGGELPESSLGMSGPVILLTQHDFDLVPGASAEVRSVSVYHPSSLEPALNAAAMSPEEGEGVAGPRGVEFASSNPSMNFAFGWAKAALFAIEGEANAAERLWCGVALSMLSAENFERLGESIRSSVMKEGAIRYFEAGPASGRSERAGPVETSLFLVGAGAFLRARSEDKKLLRRWFPRVKKAAEGLSKLAAGELIAASSESPDGWRRRLGAGFPTGSTAEVNLLAIRALREASAVAFLAGKGSDSARFSELSARLLTSLNERLRESETGDLALNVDGRGVVHKEVTVDKAVGLSFFAPDQNLASSAVHRMLEWDFETGYGPRTVSCSNSLYYSPSYGEGQLGGYWTRAAISHAILAFQSGYPSIGSSQLEKVARLVHVDAERMGGMPGEFPYWVDPERRQVMTTGTDPVAAARFMEAVLFGEGGLSQGPRSARFKVPEASLLKWLFIHDVELGGKGSIFIGRSLGRAFVASNLVLEAFEGASLTDSHSATATLSRLAECERLACPPGLEGVLFWDADSSLVCVGNTGAAAFSGLVSVPLRSKSFTTTLFAEMEELEQESWLWVKAGRVKLLSRFEAKVDLKPHSWMALRFTTG